MKVPQTAFELESVSSSCRERRNNRESVRERASNSFVTDEPKNGNALVWEVL